MVATALAHRQGLCVPLRPTETVLYQPIAEHLPAFLAVAEEGERPVYDPCSVSGAG